MSLFRRLITVLGAGGAGYQSEYRKDANIFSTYNLCSSVPVEELVATLTSFATLSVSEVRLIATGLTSVYELSTANGGNGGGGGGSFAHTSKMDMFFAGQPNTWEEYDSYAALNVPKGAVAEIIIRNANQGSERTGGVRKKGSSLERKINLHEAEGGGCTTCAMLVKTDPSDGKIEIYAENIIDTYFVLLGYFEGCDFTEAFDDLGWASAEWVGTDLSGCGVPLNAVLQIMCAQRSKNSRFFAGVREVGSSLERTILLDEAEGVTTANSIVSMIVKADINSTIERKAGVGTLRGRHHILGWFGSNIDFIEGFTLYSLGAKEDDTWILKTLTEPPASSIVVFAMAHQDSGAETLCGLRKEGSALDRYIEEHEAEGGGETGFMACITLDESKRCEVYCADASESMFFYMGHFSEVGG